MIKRPLLLLAILLLSISASAQTTSTVTGTVNVPSATAAANTKVCFSLKHYEGNVPRVSGTAIIVSQRNFCIVPASDGTFSTSLYANAAITPAGTAWRVEYQQGGIQQSAAEYTVTAPSFDLNTQMPNSTAPVVPAPTGDSTYARLDATNQPFTGALATTTFSGDILAKSGNPWIDVQTYKVRAVDPNVAPAIAGITATMTATSTTATLSAASTFQNGDGVVIYGAGAAHGMTIPAAPVVTSSLAAGGTNTGVTVAAPVGATTYSYRILLRDKQGGLTSISAIGSTTTGQAALGAVSVSVTSLARANNVVSVVAASALNVSVGAVIYVTGSTDATFSGYFLVDTVTDSTHFTYKQGQDTRAGASASATGGTVQAYFCNKLTLPAYQANGWQYIILGRSGGTLTLLGVTKPLDTVFEDYGSPFMDGVVLPSYYPANDVSLLTLSSDPLVTTIVSGAGTTSLVLANAASTSVSGATIKFDNAPNILTAANAAAKVTGTRPGVLYFSPTTAGLSYVVNSYLTFPQVNGTNLTIWQNHRLYLNETVEIKSAMIWLGDMGGGGNTIPQFAFSQERPVDINAANPGIYVANGGSLQFRGLGFTNLNNQGTIMVVDGAGFNTSADYTSFVLGTGGTDYTGMGVIIRGGAEFFFRKCLFSVSGPAAFGSALTPLLLLRNDLAGSNGSGNLILDADFFVGRGVVHDSSPIVGSKFIRATTAYTQAMRMPFLGLTSGAGSQNATIVIDGIQNDTTTAAVLAYWSNPASADVLIAGSNELSVEAGGRPGQVTGNSIARLKFFNMSAITNYGQNQSVVRIDNGEVTTPTLNLKSGLPEYNVKAFGAVGDGVTDDTAAIQAAINAACNNDCTSAAGTNDAARAVIYFPRTSSVLGYKIGSLTIPTTNHNYLVFLLDSNILWTATFQPGRRVTVIGRSGFGVTSFERGPASRWTQPAGATNVMVKLQSTSPDTASGIWLEGITLIQASGNNADVMTIGDNGVGQGVTMTTLKNFRVEAAGTGAPLHIVASSATAVNGFGLFLDDCIFSASSTGTYSLNVENFGIINARNLMLINKGILFKNRGVPSMVDADIQFALTETLNVPLITTDSTGGVVSGVTLHNADLADSTAGAYFYKNIGTNTGQIMFLHPRSGGGGYIDPASTAAGVGQFRIFGGSASTPSVPNVTAPLSGALQVFPTGNNPVHFANYQASGTDSAFAITGRQSINAGTVNGSPLSALHVCDKAGCSTQAWTGLSPSLVAIFDNTAATSYVGFGSGSNTGTVGLLFSRPNSVNAGDILYSHTSDQWELRTANVARARLDSAGLHLLNVGSANEGIFIHSNTANRTYTFPDLTGTITQTIANGTATMTTAAIASLACGTTVTVAATGVLTTDAIAFSFNAAPAANPAELVISSWPTAGNVNFQFCNPSAGSITPNASTLNWRVVR